VELLDTADRGLTSDPAQWVERPNDIAAAFNSVRFFAAFVSAVAVADVTEKLRTLLEVVEVDLRHVPDLAGVCQHRERDVGPPRQTIRANPHAPNAPPSGRQDVPTSTTAAVARAAA